MLGLSPENAEGLSLTQHLHLAASVTQLPSHALAAEQVGVPDLAGLTVHQD